MKKLIAILMSCMALTCTFTSCGDSDDDSSESKKKSGSSSSASEEETDEEETDEEETEDTSEEESSAGSSGKGSKRSEATTEEETEPETEEETEEETEPETEAATEKTTKKPGGKSSEQGGIVGYWDMPSAATEGMESLGIVLREDGTGAVYEIVTELMYMTDKGINIGGFDFGSEFVDYDGTNFVIDIEGTHLLTMKRIDGGDPASYYGEYQITDGEFLSQIAAGMSSNAAVDKSDLTVVADFEKDYTELLFEDMFTYTADDSKITMDGNLMFIAGTDSGQATVDYTLSGDDLTITAANGVKTELHRYK